MNNNNTAPTPQPTDPYSLVLTKVEIESLLGLMDLGVKAGGLQVAAAAAVLSQKIQAATPLQKIQTAQDPTPPPAGI